MIRFIIFFIGFLGGLWLMGIAHELPSMQAIVFCGGLLLLSAALAFMMTESGGATKRTNNWSDGPSAL